MRKRDRERAVKVLDLVLRFFGPHGENWLQGAEYDEQGRRCLVGALRQIERQHHINTLALRMFCKRLWATPHRASPTSTIATAAALPTCGQSSSRPVASPWPKRKNALAP